jgi:two-component system, chemotaxis family, chemotaxis protein CheY
MEEKIFIVDIEGLEEGMLAADDIKSFDGTIIIHKGMEIEGRHMVLLKQSLASKVRIIIPKEKAKPRESIHINDFENQVHYLKLARILVVDDSKLLRFKLEKALTAAGLTVVGQATNGNEAVEMAENLKPNVITLDIEMPHCDGISALEPLKQTVPEALILMISSLGEEEKILLSLAKGAFDFITKPIDPVKTVKSIINAIIINHS